MDDFITIRDTNLVDVSLIEFYVTLYLKQVKSPDLYLISMTETAKLYNNENFKLKLFQHQANIHIMPIYNSTSRHFMLSIVDQKQKIFFYFDPLINDVKNEIALEKMTQYLKQTHQTGNWIARSMTTKLQFDGTSCGVFAMCFTEMFCDAYIQDSGKIPNMKKRLFIPIERKRIEENLLKWSDDTKNICSKCLLDCSHDTMKCFMCKRAMHKTCKEQSIGTIEYCENRIICFICTNFLTNSKLFVKR